jgi:hypothetical protein
MAIASASIESGQVTMEATVAGVTEEPSEIPSRT